MPIPGPGASTISAARSDWGWNARYDLRAMVDDMMAHLKKTVLRAV
jgi:hypothetical protein